jgi:Periplasmic copper-binding protein (NosD)
VAENGAGATQSVRIENNYLSGQMMSGISVYSNQTPPSLTAVVKNNFLSIVDFGIGIESLNNVQGSISNNFIVFTTPGETGLGIMAWSPNVAVSGNRIWNPGPGFTGIDVLATASVTSNQIFGGGTGIRIEGSGATVKSNGITADSVAIEFNCNTGNTVTGNIINAANVGLDKVPAAFAGSNTFYNVNNEITGGCS